MSDFYQELCNMLIRPTRQLYHLYDLGNPIISTFGKRHDFQIMVNDGKKLQCSFYDNTLLNDNTASTVPCVIYLHSLNGSRLEFLSNIQSLLKIGFTIGILDFTGCGLSDGEYVTLGAHQKIDVLQLIKYIHRTYKQQKFFIWGRSMGAVACIKFYSLLEDYKIQSNQMRKLNILGLVLDSPFWSLDQLAVQIAKNKINIPEIVLKMAFYMIQGSIQSKANFKTCQLQLQKDVKRIRCPTLIITSKNDTLVPCEHSLTIYQNIPSQDKKLLYIQSQHNTNREKKDVLKIYSFLQEKANICVLDKPKISFLAGRVEEIKTKQTKKRHNLTLSKQKESKNLYEKYQTLSANNTHFYCSSLKQQNHIVIQDFAQNSNHKVSIKRFSFGKTLIPQEIFTNYMNENQSKKQTLNNSTEKKNYSSADRQRVAFAKQIIQNNPGNYNSLQKQTRNQSDFDSIHLHFEPKRNLKQKHSKQSSSYKNIECLKTVKKIKRLEPQTKNNCKEIIQKQQVLKSHMNVITAKLKKKAKNIMTKSFLPYQTLQGKELQYKSEKTLRKQQRVKSARNLQSSHENRTEAIHSLKNASLNESPCIQSCASNREMKLLQSTQRPLTPQILQLHNNSSIRKNEIGHQRQSSKQDIQKMYSLYQITENIKGIKTTLNNKFLVNTKDNTKEKQFLSQSIGDCHQVIKPEFMYSKNVLTSQAISMRNENKISIVKKLTTSNTKIPMENL